MRTSSLLGAHGRWGDRLRRVDLRGPRRRRLLRPADGGSLRRARARERRGDAARVWTQGRWRFWPQFTQLTVVRHRGGLLGRARPDARRPDQRLLRRARPRRGRLLRLRPGRHGRAARRARARARVARARGAVREARPHREDDEECVAAIREAIGPDRLLRIDPNEAWSVGEAVERIRRLEPFGIDWVEQPVPAGNVKGLAHVRRSVGTKIAADQAVFTTRQLLEVLREEAADVSSRAPTTPAGSSPSGSRRRSPLHTASTSIAMPSWRPR